MAKGSSNTVLLLGAAGVAVYGYMQGWFDSILSSFGAGTAAAPRIVAAANKPASAPAVTPVPALGTTVTNSADALRQVGALDAFVIPDAATFLTFQGALPGGYNTVTTTDKGQILLRPDVYAAVSAVLSNRVKRAAAAGASATSIQTAGQTTLQQIQTMMGGAGLSGLGDYRRHLSTRMVR